MQIFISRKDYYLHSVRRRSPAAMICLWSRGFPIASCFKWGMRTYSQSRVAGSSRFTESGCSGMVCIVMYDEPGWDVGADRELSVYTSSRTMSGWHPTKITPD